MLERSSFSDDTAEGARRKKIYLFRHANPDMKKILENPTNYFFSV